jgi:hypothetical protein
MNVNIVPPIALTLSSAKLFSEDTTIGVIEFQLLGQPCRLVIDKSLYTYDTTLHVGDRVKLNTTFSSFAINSEGVLQEIIIDSTQDMADVLFDKIYPVQVFQANVVETQTLGTVSVLFRVPFSYLEAA